MAKSRSSASFAAVGEMKPPNKTAFDPALDQLLDLFDDPSSLDAFTEVKFLGRGAFGQAVLMRSRAGLQVGPSASTSISISTSIPISMSIPSSISTKPFG